jgi:hypothetical protein
MLVATGGLSLGGLREAASRFGADLTGEPWSPLPEDLEPLVQRMVELAPDELMPHLVAAHRSGTSIDRLVVAGALANVRSFGGTDYHGYHAFMALLPALAMSARMPKGLEALPVLKVLYRNTARIRKVGAGRSVLAPIPAPEREPCAAECGLALRNLARERDLAEAERVLARRVAAGPALANADLQPLVQDDVNVHRIVLAMRAWDMVALAGEAHAEPLLRQLVRFCVDEEKTRVAKGIATPSVREVVPRVVDAHGLLGRQPGERELAGAAFDDLVGIVFGETPERAADAVAKALADGFAPAAVGEAISLAANRLLLHDTGKDRVHGPSFGVHASDAANAWRRVARTASPATGMTSLCVAAFHTAGQSGAVGAEPFDFRDAAAKLGVADAPALLAATAAAIEQQDQPAAMAAASAYGARGAAPEPMFDLLLRYAVSEDGALHAEKYFHTVGEEFASTRASHRWQLVVALARVTASEFGQPAPGVADVRKLLQA